MNKRHTHVLNAAILLAVPGLGFAHHGPADDLGGQLVHATFDPSHLVVTILAVGAILAAYRVIRALRRRS